MKFYFNPYSIGLQNRLIYLLDHAEDSSAPKKVDSDQKGLDWISDKMEQMGNAAERALDQALKTGKAAAEGGIKELSGFNAEILADDLESFIKNGGVDLIDNLYGLLNGVPKVTVNDLKKAISSSGFEKAESLSNRTFILMLQKWVNNYYGMSVQEDGILGPETRFALGASCNELKGHDFSGPELRKINNQFKSWKGVPANEADLRGLWSFANRLESFNLTDNIPYLVTEYIKYHPDSVGKTHEQVAPGKFNVIVINGDEFSEETVTAIERDLGGQIDNNEEQRLVKLAKLFEQIWDQPPTVAQLVFRYIHGDLNLLLPGDIKEAKRKGLNLDSAH